MREVFDRAYDGFCGRVKEFVEISAHFAECVLIAIIYTTTPLWIVPYAVFKKFKEGHGDEQK